jgi:hypothetical protein
MLYYLYTRTVDFTPLASDFLVELIKNPNNPPKSRHAFLVSKSNRTNTVVEPASPHALYELADKINLAELKELAKKAILSGFTVENVRSSCFPVPPVPAD